MWRGWWSLSRSPRPPVTTGPHLPPLLEGPGLTALSGSLFGPHLERKGTISGSCPFPGQPALGDCYSQGCGHSRDWLLPVAPVQDKSEGPCLLPAGASEGLCWVCFAAYVPWPVPCPSASYTDPGNMSPQSSRLRIFISDLLLGLDLPRQTFNM